MQEGLSKSTFVTFVAGGFGLLFLGFGLAHEAGAYPPYSKDAANTAYGIAAILGVVVVIAQSARLVSFLSQYDSERNSGCPNEEDHMS